MGNRIVTLDTGLRGAMVYFEDGVPIEAVSFKKMGKGIDPKPVVEALERWEPDRIVIEEVTVRPGQAARSTFTQGIVVGQLHQIALMACDNVEYIYPQTWCSFVKRLSLDPVRHSKDIMQEVIPKYFREFLERYRTPRMRKWPDGICDCLGLWIYLNRDDYLSHLDLYKKD
jgi:hypothetical protein